MEKTLAMLLGQFRPSALPDSAVCRPIAGLSADSREIKPGFLFFAIPGVHADGHDFIPAVLQAGAAAIIHERDLPDGLAVQARAQGATLVQVSHCRTVLSHAAAVWHGEPARSLTCIGVTGTDGKSSTTYFIHQILQAMGVRSGFFSTVAMQTADAVIPNGLRQSTPEALELHGVLADMVARGKTHAVIESTSHGLSRRTARLLDVPFRVAVFTNLSHEHLEFHGTYEQYRSDKANLFRDLVATPGQAAFAVVNAGDPEAGYFTAACRQPVLGYGSELCPPALAEGRAGRLQLFASEIAAGSDSSEFTLHYAPDGRILPWPAGSARVRLPLPGTFNIENIMAALLACAGVLSRSPLELLGALGGLVGIKGRMLPVNQGQPFSVIVDYAHTPGAYAKVLPMFRAGTTGRLIAVFGSAGERDQDKRPMQGELAARYCDELVLTNEDPRLEDELAIIDQIAAGALAQRPGMPVWRIPDRRAAIRHAIALAKPGDTVILLGKGHEQCIIFPDGKHPWDEETVARGILAESGWTGISGGAES